MTKHLGCLHAHYSNIDYIEKALAPYEIAISHFVDPGLVHRITSDKQFSLSAAQAKVQEQINWIAESQVDGILVTCTNYIALLEEATLTVSIPIMKIDEPFFDYLSRTEMPQKILFTNPATVEGTMKRLYDFALANNKPIDVSAYVIENTFELIMQGRKEQYIQEVSRSIQHLLNSGHQGISVGQLSMVDAAVQVDKETGVFIGNPLNPLVSHVESILRLGKRR